MNLTLRQVVGSLSGEAERPARAMERHEAHPDGMRIGELARRTGVSVRSLHHYHQIGLLVPAFHSPGEHRSYSRDDLIRLQQIKSLQALGLALGEIADVLDRPDHSPLETIERHIAVTSERIEEGRRLRARLERVAELLRASQDVPTEDLIETIEANVMFEKYYTPEQLEQLKRREEAVGPERIQEVQREWSELFAQLSAAQADGADETSERVQALARKARSLVEEFTGGDAGIRDSLARMYRAEGGPQVMEHHGMDVAPGVWEYMNRAMASIDENG